MFSMSTSQTLKRVSPISETGALRLIETTLAVLAIAAGLVTSILLLNRPISIDEYFTLAMTGPDLRPDAFASYLSVDAHPALSFLIFWAERLLGVSDIAVLRASNLVLGGALMAWGLLFALRNKALTPSQAWLIAAVSATCWQFLDGVAEARPYFLVACGSVVTCLVWRVAQARIENNEGLSRGLIAAWVSCILLMTNLHYFAAILAGLLTAALAVQMLVRRSWRQLTVFLGVSALAVIPATLVLYVQVHHQPREFWITSAQFGFPELIVQLMRGLALNNLVACAGLMLALAFMIERPALAREQRSALMLIGVVVAFILLVGALNALKPMVIPRYLTVLTGPVLLVAVLLATSSAMPRWMGALISAAAVLAAAEAVVTRQHTRMGWEVSAQRIGSIVAACPDTKVYARTVYEGEELDRLKSAAYVQGYNMMSRKSGFTYTGIRPGDVVPAGNVCPTIFWFEHASDLDKRLLTAEWLLRENGVRHEGPVKLEAVGTGLLVYIGNGKVAAAE